MEYIDQAPSFTYSCLVIERFLTYILFSLFLLLSTRFWALVKFFFHDSLSCLALRSLFKTLKTKQKIQKLKGLAEIWASLLTSPRKEFIFLSKHYFLLYLTYKYFWSILLFPTFDFFFLTLESLVLNSLFAQVESGK